jgi:hypothetical protein
VLDNEAPKAYLNAIESHNIDWELVPPHNHRRNVAEKGTQTIKGHIIANFMGVDDAFPMKEWHRLLPQIEMTANMLRPSNIRPTISAHSYMHGIHDYNRMPLGPLGCATQCFAGPDQRKSFGAHSIDSFYIGTSPDHYRCQKVFLPETRSERVTDTIVFKHKRITCPQVSTADAITMAAANLTEAIKSNMPKNLTNLDMKELERLVKIFEEAAKKVGENDARQPRVTSPRVQSLHIKMQQLRGWTRSPNSMTNHRC